MRTKKGTVTSAKLEKTVTVTVNRLVMHHKYRKRYPVSTRFLVDTDGKTVKEGDEVIIGETRPLSRRKRFKVLEIVGSSQVPGMSVEEEVREVSGGNPVSGSDDDASHSNSNVTTVQ